MTAPPTFLSKASDGDELELEGVAEWKKRHNDDKSGYVYTQHMKEHHRAPSDMPSPSPTPQRHLSILGLDNGVPSFHHAFVPSRDDTTSPSCRVPQIRISPPPDNQKRNPHHLGLTVDTRSYEIIPWPGYMGPPSTTPSPTTHHNGSFELDRRSYSSDSGISVSGSTYSSPSHHHVEIEEPRRGSQSSTLAPDDLCRSRPQCWERGCNGRSFSTFSTLLRHQSESHGTRMYNIPAVYGCARPANEHEDEVMEDAGVPSSERDEESVVDSTTIEEHEKNECSPMMKPSQPFQELTGSSICQAVSLDETELEHLEIDQDDQSPEDVLAEEPRASSDLSSSSGISSNTEVDSSEDEDDQYTNIFQDKKKALLDRLMVHFYTMFYSQSSPSPSWPRQSSSPGENEAPGSSSNPGSREASEGGSYTPSFTTSSGISVNLSNTRKRQSIEREEDEESPSRKRPKWDASGQSDAQEILPKLACPFFKKNPDVYRKQRSCPGPGWSTVHRIKEHVYRRHALPITCPRCHETFDTDKLKDEHTAARVRCEAQEAPPIEGMNATQKELLRCRKRAVKNMGESEKWKEMYLILFPETVHESIPSPYYEYKSTETQAQDGATSEFTRYEQFLRSELPPRVQRALETRLDETLNPIEESLRSELVGIVRDMQIQLFDMYKLSRGATGNAGGDDAVPGSVGEAPPPNLAGLSQIHSIEDALEPFNQPPDAEFMNDFDAFDGLVFNFPESDPSVGLDSGYQSLLFENTKARGDDSFE